MTISSDDASESARAALRAYLQRCEVRLSTMHRIGGAFISGAGLLVLLPLFMQRTIDQLVEIFRSVPIGVTYPFPIFCFAIPAAIALVVPLIALWMLLRELIHFYFSADIPEPSDTTTARTFHPRLALTAIPIADDECPEQKSAIRHEQFTTRLRKFLLSSNSRQNKWLDEMMKDDASRRVALPAESQFLDGIKERNEWFDRMRLAYGLAGAYDRNLVQEAAKSEISLIRHNLILRRLVMRYMKALVLFLWTAVVLFLCLPLAKGSAWPTSIEAITGAFLFWSALASFLVRAPMRWIYHLHTQDTSDRTRDPHLKTFEQFMSWICLCSTLIGSALLIGGLRVREEWAVVLVCFAVAIDFVVIARSHGKADWAPLRWI